MQTATPSVTTSSVHSRELARRTLARRRLLYFVQQTQAGYLAGWVHQDLCERLERFSAAVVAGKSPRLMVLMPPRHGKSQLASIHFPAWHIGHNPSHELVNVGYNMDLPSGFSRKVRETMRDPFYQAIFPDAALDPDAQGIESWKTKKAGSFTAVGVGGGLTGKGSHILIVDDPLKNIEEADNVEIRKALEEWYESTAYTRLAPGGGVLLIQCMTGDTPVLLADSTQKRLDELSIGDHVATYDRGKLSTSRVLNWKSNGRDSVYTITMTSGRTVRANGRHPFLASLNGELSWTRTKDLTTAHTIVTLPASGVSGKESSVSKKGAPCRRSAADGAPRTTTSSAGLTGIALLRSILRHVGARISSIVMGSRSIGTMNLLLGKVVSVLFARCPQGTIHPATGRTSSASITATTQVKYGGSCATTVTLRSAILKPSTTLSPLPPTSDFTLDQVLSVVETGVEEVFDVQIERTENFIANGLVSHNTWWNDDDLAGRLQQKPRTQPGADVFEVVKYPAISEEYEYRHPTTRLVVRSKEVLPEPHDLELLRGPTECLHEARYPLESLQRIKANMQPRIWSALYQQNPMPDEGVYFRKEYLRRTPYIPPVSGNNIFTAWDFAIGLKQQNDWNVGATILQDSSDNLYVLEILRFKGDSFDIVEGIVGAIERWGSVEQGSYRVGFEDGQIWRSIEPILKRRLQEKRLYPSREVLKPLTDKLARARPLQGRMQQGKFFFPTEASWMNQAENELLRFPGGAHDDVVDALAWVTRLCMGHQPPSTIIPPVAKSWRDRLEGSEAGDVGHMAA